MGVGSVSVFKAVRVCRFIGDPQPEDVEGSEQLLDYSLGERRVSQCPPRLLAGGHHAGEAVQVFASYLSVLCTFRSLRLIRHI